MTFSNKVLGTTEVPLGKVAATIHGVRNAVKRRCILGIVRKIFLSCGVESGTDLGRLSSVKKEKKPEISSDARICVYSRSNPAISERERSSCHDRLGYVGQVCEFGCDGSGSEPSRNGSGGRRGSRISAGRQPI